MTKRKVVILNSGGIDSRALAKVINKEENEIHSLYIHMPKVPSAEKQKKAAQETADMFCDSHYVVTYQSDFTGLYFDNRTKTYIKPIDINEEDKEYFEKLRLTPTPYAKNILFSMALSYARAIGAKVVVGGHNSTEMFEWCKEFAKLSNASTPFINRSDANHVGVEAPFIGLDDNAITDLLTDEEYATTISCTKAIECGDCHSCKRKEKFETWKKSQ